MNYIKACIQEMDANNSKAFSTLVDYFVHSYEEELKYKILELWADYQAQAEKSNSLDSQYFSDN